MASAARWALGLLFIGAGVLPLVRPEIYDPAMLPWVPMPRAMILISGLAEVAGGVGLIQRSPHLRRRAGWGLVALLIAVYPANVWMATSAVGGPSWLLWGRLPLQGALVAAVLAASGSGARTPPR